ncbi:MAG: NAD(+) synthase [Clostridia bacterium]|nr:NAD(+) synthase [Clostridia bacterium]
MKHGFLKVAVASPDVRIADPAFCANELIRIAKDADKRGVRVLVFPELSLTGYTCGDLFFSETLIRGAKEALMHYLSKTADLELLSVVGLPLAYNGKLYNCAAVCCGGEILGIVPKTHLQNAKDSSEARYFAVPDALFLGDTLSLGDMEVSFGTHMIFACENMDSLRIAVEFGSECMLPNPPSVAYTAEGATLICAPAADAERVGREEFRRAMVLSQSARTVCGYLYANAGTGESTTDTVFGGHSMICENGKLLAEKAPFDTADSMVVSEIDLDLVLGERRRAPATPCEMRTHLDCFSFTLSETTLTRSIAPSPFLPADRDERIRRCDRILAIQTEGLKARIERAFAKKIVLGISGGLDSTLALLVMVRAMDALRRPRTDIIAVTMPCFGTTKRTKTNATVLCEELGVDFRCVDIFDAVNLHFRDIGHDPEQRDVTYENAQARERTQVLMDVANDCGGMVIGTGDLSELALGWATYNGDHMSMYGVNASIPKTLVRHLVSHCADLYDADGKNKIAAALRDVLGTPVSPELLPANENGEIAQKTEDLVGPYEIHDFYLYYALRYGFSPAKLYRMAKHALGDVYDDETLKKWLRVFFRRFFAQQFKRSCSPDGPAVGSVSLSPRGAWCMPSDACSALWLAEIDEL